MAELDYVYLNGLNVPCYRVFGIKMRVFVSPKTVARELFLRIRRNTQPDTPETVQVKLTSLPSSFTVMYYGPKTDEEILKLASDLEKELNNGVQEINASCPFGGECCCK